MKIPLILLKEYIKTMEQLGADDLNVEFINNNFIPEYCLFISGDTKYAIEIDREQKEKRKISASFKIQPTHKVTLLFNTSK